MLRALLLLATLPLCADGLGDLRAALGRLQGPDTAKVSFEYQFRRELQEGKGPSVTQGAVTAQVEDGPQGLRITWDRATLLQAEGELQGAFQDPLKPAPISQILRSLTSLDIDEHLHGAQTLLRDLTGAHLKETRPDAWQGKPAQLLVLDLEAVINPNIRPAVKEVKAQGLLWVGSDGSPLAFRSDVAYKGSRFLIAFHGIRKEELHYQRRGNRLLVTWAQSEERTSGFGESVGTKREYHITASEKP
jgi:hypothetical protein